MLGPTISLFQIITTFLVAVTFFTFLLKMCVIMRGNLGVENWSKDIKQNGDLIASLLQKDRPILISDYIKGKFPYIISAISSLILDLLVLLCSILFGLLFMEPYGLLVSLFSLASFIVSINIVDDFHLIPSEYNTFMGSLESDMACLLVKGSNDDVDFTVEKLLSMKNGDGERDPYIFIHNFARDIREN